MFELLKTAHDKAEELEGRNLANVLVVVFIVFLFLGIGINYITKDLLNNNELSGKSSGENSKVAIAIEETFQEGTITYIDPQFYPGENISYYLADSNGSQLILLKAADQKLQVLEGLYVKVYGRETTTKDKKNEVLLVDRVVVKNSKK